MKKTFISFMMGLILASLGANLWLWFSHSQLKLETEALSGQVILQKKNIEAIGSEKLTKTEDTKIAESESTADAESRLADHISIDDKKMDEPITQEDDGVKDQLVQLSRDLKDLEAKVVLLETSSKTTTTPVAASQTTTIIQESSKVKEHYVYLGTGSTTSRDWQDIDSTITVIDSANYSSVKSVNFEAAMSILGGEVHARLANKDSAAVFYDSEVYHNTSSSNWKISSALSLNYGATRYVVQLKSTSGEKANLDGARIKIVVE
jgi:hypothetical protein